MQESPKSLEPYRIAQTMKEKRIDESNYSLGIYILEAIAACFGGAEYPKEPFTHRKVLTDEEKLEQFILSMQALEKSWKSNHDDANNGGADE